MKSYQCACGNRTYEGPGLYTRCPKCGKVVHLNLDALSIVLVLLIAGGVWGAILLFF